MTQLVYPFTLVPGQPENVNQLNDNLGAIQNVVNGNIGADNVQDASLSFDELTTQVQNGLVDSVQAGVIGSGDGLVTYASAAGVSVAAGTAWVPNASGLLRRVTWAGNALTVPVSTGTRLDQIVIDSTGTLSRVAGTEQAAGVVTLDNRTGAAALPTGTLRLGDLLITTAGVVNSTSNIRDRRPWATGATAYRTHGNGAGDYVFSATVFGYAIPEAVARIECSGKPIRIRYSSNAVVSTAGGTFAFAVDGDLLGVSAVTVRSRHLGILGVNLHIDLEWWYPATAGSHLIGVVYKSNSTGNLTQYSSVTNGGMPEFSLEEMLCPPGFKSNGTV